MQRHVPTIRTLRPRAHALAAASLLVMGLATFALNAKAQAPAATLPSTGTIAIPTYEAVGLTWQSPGASSSCEVKYRKAGESAWAQGLPMWYDSRDQQCRGSLLNLTPDTYYQVEFALPGQAPSRGLVFRTWSNRLPVAKTIAVNGGSGTFNVAEGGSASGYVVYEGNGAVLDAQNGAQFNVTINASYVIVRGLVLKGAKQDAIRISPNVKDVVIEDNEISGWGRQRSGNWGVDMDSAIRAVCTQPTLERVTIQRNRIHSPRYSANSWSDGHPAGPQAIAFSYCGGNHVFRHNDVYSGNGNYFNDIFGGEDNFTLSGFPNADTDIYGNKISHAWDDAIEAEGANENVRIWGNYMDRTALGVATTATSIGPVYIFRNVWNRSKFYEKVAPDTDDRQPFFKSGGDNSLGHGRRFVFHNTMLQAQEPGAQYGLGGGFGMGGTGSAQLITNTWSKNNIYHLWKPGKGAMYQTGSGNDMSHDMYNGTPGDATIVNGISGTPVYAPGHGWQSEAGGNYQLAASSPGYDKGVRIPNVNDGFTGAAPDVGAHEAGTPPMKFGIAASPGSVINAAGTPSAPTTPTDPTTPTGPTGPGGPTAPSGPATPPAPVTGSGIVVSRATLDFGGGAPATQSVTFTNNTASRVTFIQASMSSGKYGQTNNCGEVAPGASCTSTVTYYANGSGSGSATLTITSNAPNSPHVVTLTNAGAIAATPTQPAAGAPIAGPVTVSASALAFSAAATTRTVTFTNTTSGRITFIQASMSSGKFGQTNNCGEVAPGASCTATVTYYPTNSGADSATFTVTSTAPNSPHVLSLTAAAAPVMTASGANPMARGTGIPLSWLPQVRTGRAP